MPSRFVIEWTRSSVRLAVADIAGGRTRLRQLRSRPLGPGGEAAEALKALLGQKPSAGAEIIGVIAREQVITRVVKFPATQTAELSQMVELYARAQLPYPREQTVMDFHILTQEGGFSTVAIVACQREVTDRYLALFKGIGIVPNRLTLSSWGVLEWFRKSVPERSVPEPVLVVNLDEARTDLVLIEAGRILSSRSAGQGTQEWMAYGDPVELLALEVERSRAAIRKELPGADVRALALTGAGPVGEWNERLTKRLGMAVTTVPAAPSLPGNILVGEFPGSPVVAAGIATGALDGFLNLTPDELRVQLTHRRQVSELAMVSLLAAAVLLLAAGAMMLQLSRERRTAAQVDQLVSGLMPMAKRLQQQAHAAEFVSTTLADRRRLVDTLAGIFRMTPEAITLEAVAVERARREVTVRGSASSTQDVIGYVKQLEGIGGVASVQLKHSTRRMTPAGERADFEIALSQEAPAS